MKDEELYEDENEEEEEEEVDEGYSIRKAKKDILKAMSKLDPTSEDYMILSARLTEITECDKNEKGWIVPAFIQGGIGLIQTGLSYFMSNRSVKNVLDYEDRGNILNTKATQFLRKPRE